MLSVQVNPNSQSTKKSYEKFVARLLRREKGLALIIG